MCMRVCAYICVCVCLYVYDDRVVEKLAQRRCHENDGSVARKSLISGKTVIYPVCSLDVGRFRSLFAISKGFIEMRRRECHFPM